MIITIDGPVCSGKSTIARGLAHTLDFSLLNTGAIYRAIALVILENNLGSMKENDIIKALNAFHFDQKMVDGVPNTFINGKNRTSELRSEIISNTVALYSKIEGIRVIVRKLQHKIADNNNIVVEGRDIGTVVFPKADVKFFVTASDEVRAKRRYEDYISQGRDCDKKTILDEIKERDRLDMERENSPLIKADDAIIIDNSDLSVEQSVEKMKKIVTDKKKQKRSE